MKPTPIVLNGQTIGRELRVGKAIVFFGYKNCSLDHIKEAYPGLSFKFLKQVHSNKFIPATDGAEADGHWTQRRGEAIGVYTADCLPILLYSKHNNLIGAIHAGWRGLELRIIREAMDFFKSQNTDPADVYAFVGPHIKKENFEVDLDVAERLLKAGPPDRSAGAPHANPQKMWIDLAEIAKYQLLKTGIWENQIYWDPDNTFGNPLYFSYRGDRANCGRLISFVANVG